MFTSNIYLCIDGLLTFLSINSFERIWIVTFISIHSFVWITQKYKKQKYTNTPVWKCKYTYLRKILSLGNKMEKSNIDHSAISFFVIWRVWRHWHEVKIFWRKKCWSSFLCENFSLFYPNWFFIVRYEMIAGITFDSSLPFYLNFWPVPNSFL